MKPRTFLLILLAGGLARLISIPLVFDEGTLCFVGGPDAYYHFRRAELAAAGQLSDFDAWTNFPTGLEVHWPKPYAHLLGIVLAFFGQLGLVFFPVLAGILSIVAFRRLTTRPSMLLLFAIIPAAVMVSCAGAIDHHCLEAALFAFALSGRVPGIIASIASFGLISTWPVVAVAACATEVFRRKEKWIHVVGAVIAAVIVPVAGAGYLFDPWMQEVKETKPLISSAVDIAKSFELISLSLLAFPFALPHWWRSRSDPKAAAALAGSLVALPLALIQIRFVILLAVPGVLAIGEVLAFLERKFRPRVAVMFLVSALAISVSGTAEILTWSADPSTGIRRALEFMRAKTPEPGDFLQPEERPSYGVGASWDLGHYILAIGTRPAMANAFHLGREGRELSEQIFAASPAEGTAAADKAGIRYLLLNDGRVWMGGLFERLYVDKDTGLGWKPVFQSPESFQWKGDTIPIVQIWEREK